MTVNLNNYIYSLDSMLVQLALLIFIAALIQLTTAQEIGTIAPTTGLKYYVFTEECFETFFQRQDWFHVHCLKKTLVKLLGYAVVVGAAIVKVPQIIKIIKRKTTFGISFPSVILETFTQLCAVAYNISRANPFSVYGETLFISFQCILIHLLFIIYADEKSGKRKVYLVALLPVLVVVYAALNPEYFPKYIIEHAMIAQIILFSGARLLQIYEIHKVRSTGSLSQITCSLVVLGNLSRLATALVEVADDFLYGLSVFIAVGLNGYILLCFLIFRSKSKVEQKKE